MLYLYNKETQDLKWVHNVVDALHDYSKVEPGYEWLFDRDLHELDDDVRIAFLQKLNARGDRKYFITRSGAKPIPVVGELISSYINGDYRPDGQVESITASGITIISSTGHKYSWSPTKGGWYYAKSFALVLGHINVTNPEV